MNNISCTYLLFWLAGLAVLLRSCCKCDPQNEKILKNSLNFMTTTSDFKSLRLETDDGLYVDKSLLIKEFGEALWKSKIIFRPPKYGKTVNMNMLERFYKIPDDEQEAKLNRNLFLGGDIEVNGKNKTLAKLKIADHVDIINNYLGKYPVISLSFKNCNFTNAFAAMNWVNQKIANFFYNRKYLGEYLKSEGEDIYFDRTRYSYLQIDEFYLKYLIEYVRKYHRKEVVVLIDDYDYAIRQSYLFHGSGSKEFDKIVSFLRSVMRYVPVEHTRLFVTTSTLPNYGIEVGAVYYSVLNTRFSSFFGFTDEEVNQLLARFPSLQSSNDEIKNYHRGLYIGNEVMYNPRSILECLKNNGILEPNLEDEEYLKAFNQIPINSTKMGQLYHFTHRRISKQIFVAFGLGSWEFNLHDWESINHDGIIRYLIFTGWLKITSSDIESDHKWMDCSATNVAAEEILHRKIVEWICTNLRINQTDHRNELQDHLIHVRLNNFTKLVEHILHEAAVNKLYSGAQHYYIDVLEGLITYKIKNRRFYHVDPNNPTKRIDIIFADTSTKGCVLGVIMAIYAVQANHADTLETLAEQGLRNISTMGYETELHQQNSKVQYVLRLCLTFCNQRVGMKSHFEKTVVPSPSQCNTIRKDSFNFTKPHET